MTVSEQIKSDLLDMVQKHDYSYMMSDSHNVWESGMQYERNIKAKVHALCTIHREDAEALYSEIVHLVQEQYVDGLTHKVIAGWFAPYVESI